MKNPCSRLSGLILLASAAILSRDGSWAQPVRTFVLGEGASSWSSGGNGLDPTILASGGVDTTNTPGDGIDFEHQPGWITPLLFDEEENVARRVLVTGSISSPNARGFNQRQLEGIVNGSHLTAFERKPTLFDPLVVVRGIRVILDFGTAVGVHRIRFYPRNTVVATPSAPFQDDFLRSYELFLNASRPSTDSPDVLVVRDTENEEAVVDLSVPAQYVRVLTLKSLANVPFEIDEIEVYGTGYLQQATYLSDLIDLGDRATVGPVRWVEKAVGREDLSQLSVRIRTGIDSTPILYRQIVRGGASTSQAPELREITPLHYFALDRVDRAPLTEDTANWSPWFSVESGQLSRAPNPRRYLQLRLDFTGGLFVTRAADRVAFDFLQPPLADTLRAEIFPRLAEAEKPATFRYAVLLKRAGPIRGYDRLEVDTIVEADNIREVKLAGMPTDFSVDFIRPDAFGLSFPLIDADNAVLEFTFDLPIFRFGSTFSGRAYNSDFADVPQVLQPGNALVFGPGDADVKSSLSVEIPKSQIGKLVGEISSGPRVFTPNGDGINDSFDLAFNLLQLTDSVPVRLDLFDLAGRRIHTLFSQQRSIGPLAHQWDGCLANGILIPPGVYVWVLRVRADAFEERHSGTLAIVY